MRISIRPQNKDILTGLASVTGITDVTELVNYIIQDYNRIQRTEKQPTKAVESKPVETDTNTEFSLNSVFGGFK